MTDPFQRNGLTFPLTTPSDIRPQYSVTNPPAMEPITRDDAAQHVRIDSPEDLEYLAALVSVAREYIEGLTGRVAVLSELLVVAPSWASFLGRSADTIKIMRTPLVSVTSIKYYAPDASELTTMASEDYRVITSTEPGLIQITGEFPSVDARPDAIQITFKAGNPKPCDSSPMLRHAMKMVVAHLYEQRVPIAFAQAHELPHTLNAIVSNLKISGFSS
jgi:uncharacterized phiE125 gp8 family phage protein